VPRPLARFWRVGSPSPSGTALVTPALALAVMFACCPSIWAQISLVHVTSCGPGSFPGTTCSIPATGKGNLIVIGWQMGGSGTSLTISGVTDNVGNTYFEAGAARSIDTVVGTMADIWYAKNSVAGATSINIGPSSATTNGLVVVWEFTGADPGAPLDQSATLNSQASTTVPIGAAITTAAPVEVVVSITVVANTVSGIYPGSPFTNDSTLQGNGWAHLVTSSTGKYTAQWNQSAAGTYASSTVSFKAAGQVNACDLNQDRSVDILDVQLATDMALSPSNCSAPFGQCNAGFANAVLADAMGGTCIVPVLNLAPSSVSFGTVTVNSGATQTVTLTGNGTSSTTITQATVTGGGFSISGLSLPLTLAVGQSSSFNAVFTPTSAGSVSGNIAFQSNALVSPLNLPLSGTGGSSSSHYATLSWTPSTSSNVVSYTIYRITSSSSTAPLTPYPPLASMSATTCTQTTCTYTDSAVGASLSYWYYATAVDSNNNVSAPSNTAQATIPSP
jgi:hypothetical protein